jgi:processive 1,2-diacylglycerol beta-glucosyltransferase
VRVTAVCGRNEKLERHLKNVFKHVPGAEIYGYVERVDELMRRSDGIVTKAGGVTLSEAIQMNVPIFIFKPIPGQEKENARFLADKGAAQVSRTVGELADQIERLLFDGETARRMKHRLRELQTRHASDTIVHDIIHVVMERSHSDNSIA